MEKIEMIKEKNILVWFLMMNFRNLKKNMIASQ